MLIWNSEAGLVTIGQPSISGGMAHGVSFDGTKGSGNRGANPVAWTRGLSMVLATIAT